MRRQLPLVTIILFFAEIINREVWILISRIPAGSAFITYDDFGTIFFLLKSNNFTNDFV